MSGFKIYSRTSDILYYVLNVVALALLIYSYAQLNTSDYTYLQALGNNWNKGPIIEVNTQGLVCNADEEPLINDEWHGTQEGCYCSNTIIGSPLRVGRCRRKRDSIFCDNVPAYPPVQFKAWRGRNICGKRIPAAYLDLSIAKNDKSCPMNQRSCGIIDSLNNVLCIPNETPCPMNYVKVRPSNVDIPKDRTYSVIKGKDANILFTNENTAGKIINEFKISDGQPCAIPYYENYSFTPYLLDPYQNRGKCVRGLKPKDSDEEIFTNNQYELIDTYSNYDVLNENGILPIIKNLPLYPAAEVNHNTNLYHRNYIGLNPTCIADIKETGDTKRLMLELVTMETKMGSYLTIGLVAMIMQIIVVAFVTIFAIVLICMLCRASDDSETSSKLWFFCIVGVLNLVVFILCCVLASGLASYSSDYKYLADPNCVDNNTYLAVSHFEESLMSSKNMSVVTAIINGVILALPIVNLIVMCMQ